MEQEQACFEKIMEIQNKIVPELQDILMKRYNILRLVHYHQPIGRRYLSGVLEVGERIVRGEVALLKDQGLIEVTAEGMKTTELGENILDALRNWVHHSKGLMHLEREMAQKLNIRKVLIIPGKIEEDAFVLKEIGKVASQYLKSLLRQEVVIGITGGNTMAAVAEETTKGSIKFKNITVVPARGGLGKDVEKQANTIAARLADKIGADYKLLHMPDNIERNVFVSLGQDPSIQDVLEYIRKIQILVFGIGRADTMAHRRGLAEREIGQLLQNGAVSEAFGYYFNKDGRIVREVNNVGVDLNMFKGLKSVIGAAAGEEKSEAVMAISKLNKNLILVIDEGLARKISNNNRL